MCIPEREVGGGGGGTRAGAGAGENTGAGAGAKLAAGAGAGVNVPTGDGAGTGEGWRLPGPAAGPPFGPGPAVSTNQTGKSCAIADNLVRFLFFRRWR